MTVEALWVVPLCVSVCCFSISKITIWWHNILPFGFFPSFSPPFWCQMTWLCVTFLHKKERGRESERERWCVICVCVCVCVCMFNTNPSAVKDSSTLQHTATHCNTPHCNILQHTATHCITLQQSATICNNLQQSATHCKTLQDTATHQPTASQRLVCATITRNLKWNEKRRSGDF